MPTILRNASGDLIAKRTFVRSPTYLNVSKNILARQSIFKNVDCNIDHNMKKPQSILTQQQIKQSSIYQRLMMRIQRLKQRQQQQKIQHQKTMKQLQQQINQTKQSIKQDKLNIWQVRNETIQLEEIFNQQIEEYEYLCHVLQQLEMHNHHGGFQQFMRGEQQGYSNMEGYGYNQGEQTQQQEQEYSNQYTEQDSTNRDQTSQQLDSFSKPTCSIKLMITERSITNPDLENLQTNSGRQPFSNVNYQNYTQNSMYQQSQQELKNQRTLSFKKSSHIFTLQG